VADKDLAQAEEALNNEDLAVAGTYLLQAIADAGLAQ
jgi:hypothetical protein